jgi:uncharacterized protein YdhG (YjbR/CyaY superfamily)
MTVNDYFNAIPTERYQQLKILQTAIKEIFPSVVEDLSYKLPTYSFNNHKICAIASQKNYMSFYIMHYDLLDFFKEDLVNFNCGKSCIRFKKLDEPTLILFKNILIFLKENINKSEFYKS